MQGENEDVICTDCGKVTSGPHAGERVEKQHFSYRTRHTGGSSGGVGSTGSRLHYKGTPCTYHDCGTHSGTSGTVAGGGTSNAVYKKAFRALQAKRYGDLKALDEAQLRKERRLAQPKKAPGYGEGKKKKGTLFE
jgi:hypothetical protein